LKKGDIIHLDFEAWLIDNNELFDTTKEKVAKDNDVYDEKVTYKPIPMIVGAKKVVTGLDDDLLKAKVGKEYTIEIDAKDGFGERDPKLIEMHSRREILRLPEFKKGDKEPYVGMQIVMNNKMGWISAITAGRIRLDFNNRYAGRRLKYKYKIMDHAQKPDEKVKAIVEMHYGKVEDFNIALKKNDVVIKLPDACKYDLGWFQTKYRVVSDLREYVTINNVQFIEEYVKKVDAEKDKDKDKDKGKGKENDKKESKTEKEPKESESKKEDVPKEKKESKEPIETKEPEKTEKNKKE
jgi:FKBP-type peptidyl-prolyl cis-trans isomerase 2